MMNVPHGPFKKTTTFKIGKSGRGVANTTLEKLLLKFMAELDETHLQFLSRLLIMEALDNYPDWLGGPEGIRFMDRAHCFVQRFKDRNKLAWRMPTTIGQKRPAGYQSKWRICSEFY